MLHVDLSKIKPTLVEAAPDDGATPCCIAVEAHAHS